MICPRLLLPAALLLTLACEGDLTIREANGPGFASEPESDPDPVALPQGPEISKPPAVSESPVIPEQPPVTPKDPGPLQPAEPVQLILGTLNPKVSRAPQVAGAGLQTVEFVISWTQYEPQQGQFNPDYLASRKADLARFLAAGIRPTLSFSHHYTPAWVCALPGAAFVDQNGASHCGKPHNMVFSQPVRDAMNQTLAHIAANFAPSSFSAVRIMTAGVAGEISYPSGGTFWAYDANASGGKDRPVTIPVRPLGNWKPGDAGRTAAEVRSWLNWYLAALADAVNFQIDTYLALGFRGPFHPIQPGAGVKPRAVESAIACHLSCAGKYLGQGVAWYNLFAYYKHKSLMTVYTSSLGQGATGQDCMSSDAAISPTAAEVSSFDVGRYTAYIAKKYGVRPAGENPGPLDPDYGAEMMKAAVRVARSCNYSHLYWAHEDQLFSTQRPGLTLDALVAASRPQ